MGTNMNEFKPLKSLMDAFTEIQSHLSAMYQQMANNRKSSHTYRFLFNLFQMIVIVTCFLSHSEPVHFNAQRTSNYDKSASVIPYDSVTLNVGGGMNAATGVFTAPKGGNYQLMFTGRNFGEANTHVDLRLNGGQKVLTRSYNHKGNELNNGGPISIQTIVNLKQGDRIDAFLATGKLLDNADQKYTQFSGVWLSQ